MSDEAESALLRKLAAKYVWWKSPEEACEMPSRVMAQVMNIGEFSDVEALREAVGEDRLRQVITEAQPGAFNERSWHYWHYRLGLSAPLKAPELPRRRFG